MIDWITAILPCDHDPSKLISGCVMSYDAQGNQEWIVNKRVTVEGSHSAKIQVRTHTERSIWISGNPAKFLQGHNIFGSDDLVYLVGRFFDALLKFDELGLKPTDSQYERVMVGDYQLTRVDVNQSWHLPSKSAVLSWIRSAGSCAYLKHRGAGQFSADTLYFGKNSRYWAVKCYAKGHELTAKKHQLPKALQIPELIDWADKSLRIELVMRSMFLKACFLNLARNWSLNDPKMLLSSLVLENLQLTDNMAFHDTVLDKLPKNLRLVYAAWTSGQDIRQIYSKASFYRYRHALLAYNVDIALPLDNNRSNVIPLIRYLEASPAEIPHWAYDKGLVA